jgi:hypothetical protein
MSRGLGILKGVIVLKALDGLLKIITKALATYRLNNILKRIMCTY